MSFELNFDISSMNFLEFGVGRDQDDSQVFYKVRVGENAQKALHDMVIDTWSEMIKSVEGRPTQTMFEEVPSAASINILLPTSDEQTMQKKLKGGPHHYSPSDKYAGTEYLYLPLDHDSASELRNLYYAINLPLENQLFDDPDTIFSYFVRMQDSLGRRITALRRATGFKGVLKSNLLAPITGDALELYGGKIFKLDNDFDIILDSDHVHIWRPNSFEAVGKLQQAILDAVPDNIRSIGNEIGYVDFDEISNYARTHIMAARYLASIRAQASEGPISKEALLRLCEYTEIYLKEQDGKIIVTQENVMGFLEVLDRRRYGIELVEGQREQFRATSRQRIKR